jgi:hypothetical protein
LSSGVLRFHQNRYVVSGGDDILKMAMEVAKMRPTLLWRCRKITRWTSDFAARQQP